MPSTAVSRPSGRGAEVVDPRLVDVVLAVGMALVVSVVVAADLEATGRAGPPAYLFAVGFGGLVLARRHAPRVVLALTVIGIFVYYIFPLPPIGIALPAVAALYSAAEMDRTRWASAAGAVLVSVAAYFRVEEGLPSAYLFSYDLLTDIALAAAAVALGVSVRSRRELRVRQEQLRQLTAVEERREAERRLQAERVGIARDLHDTIGHTLSVVAVHSSVAAEAIGRDEAAAARALERVRAATAETMRELRSTVKLLRSPTAERAERDATGLADLAHLVRQAEEAGVAVDAEIDVAPHRLDAAVDATAYRVVQESLTNVLRHSGAGHATVVAELRDGTLHVSIVDDGHGAARPGTAPPDGGRGIRGMAERIGLLGGTFAAGDGADGGFVVRATLPARLVP